MTQTHSGWFLKSLFFTGRMCDLKKNPPLSTRSHLSRELSESNRFQNLKNGKLLGNPSKRQMGKILFLEDPLEGKHRHAFKKQKVWKVSTSNPKVTVVAA